MTRFYTSFEGEECKKGPQEVPQCTLKTFSLSSPAFIVNHHSTSPRPCNTPYPNGSIHRLYQTWKQVRLLPRSFRWWIKQSIRSRRLLLPLPVQKLPSTSINAHLLHSSRSASPFHPIPVYEAFFRLRSADLFERLWGAKTQRFGRLEHTTHSLELSLLSLSSALLATTVITHLCRFSRQPWVSISLRT